MINEGDFIAINGTNGEVTLDDVPLVDPKEDPAFDEILAGLRDACSAGADDAAHARRAHQRRHAAGRATRRASWAPRASACAGRSTCSWPRTASRDAADDHGRHRDEAPRARSPSCCRFSRRTSRACSRR